VVGTTPSLASCFVSVARQARWKRSIALFGDLSADLWRGLDKAAFAGGVTLQTDTNARTLIDGGLGPSGPKAWVRAKATRETRERVR
jgi:hypothetical protein